MGRMSTAHLAYWRRRQTLEADHAFLIFWADTLKQDSSFRPQDLAYAIDHGVFSDSGQISSASTAKFDHRVCDILPEMQMVCDESNLYPHRVSKLSLPQFPSIPKPGQNEQIAYFLAFGTFLATVSITFRTFVLAFESKDPLLAAAP